MNSLKNLNDLNARLDGIRMSSYERLQAKAHLARAEAVADAVLRVIAFVKRMLKQPKSVDKMLSGERSQGALG